MAINIGALVQSGLNGGSNNASTSQGGGWGDIVPMLVNAGTSLLGGYMAGEGGRKAADAQSAAAQQQLALYRQIYGDQRALGGPNYLTSGAAMNLLASQYGIGPQNYQAAFNGGSSFGGGGGYGGASAANNWGAGQPVQGHWNGGSSSNPLAGLAGTIGGSFLPGVGNVVGGAIGGALGGLVRSDADNWTTLATGAPEGFDYATYMQSPDLAAEWGKKDVQSLFNGNRDAYANWHYNQFGKNEGRTLSPLATQSPTDPNMGGGGVGMGGGQGQPMNPLAGFWASPQGQLAEKGFLSVDTPQVQGAFAQGGKSLSGAATKALYDRGQARASTGYNNYLTGLQNLAGMSTGVMQQLGNAGANYAAGGSNALLDAGKAKANGLESSYKGWGQGISGALGSVQDYGKKNWGWG